MEALEAIFKRRSIRKYDPQRPLEEGKLKTILRAAMSAPTARNIQDWEFFVVNTPEGKQKIMQVHPYSLMLKTAPCAIIVCANKERSKNWEGYFEESCAAALQNILIAATGLGLGSVWLGVYPREEVRTALHETFEMPANIMPVGIAVIGYAAEIRPEEDRYDTQKVHFNSWTD